MIQQLQQHRRPLVSLGQIQYDLPVREVPGDDPHLFALLKSGRAARGSSAALRGPSMSLGGTSATCPPNRTSEATPTVLRTGAQDCSLAAPRKR